MCVPGPPPCRPPRAPPPPARPLCGPLGPRPDATAHMRHGGALLAPIPCAPGPACLLHILAMHSPPPALHAAQKRSLIAGCGVRRSTTRHHQTAAHCFAPCPPPRPPPLAPAQVSSLVLRLEALLAGRLLTAEQGSLLRTLAWQRDTGLIKLYQARGRGGGGDDND